MTEYIVDDFGIWKVDKRDKGLLEDLGFFNSYQGIENVRKLVLRTSEYDSDVVELVFNKRKELIDTGQLRFFRYKLRHIDSKAKMIKRLYPKIKNLEQFEDVLNAPVSTDLVLNFAIKVREKEDDKDYTRVLQILELKNDIKNELFSNRRLVEVKTVGVEHCMDLTDYRGSKHYTPEEIEFIKHSFGRISVKDIAESLGRTVEGIKHQMRRLKKEGEI